MIEHLFGHENVKIHQHDPVMLISKHNDNTIIIFATGKFRIMGAFAPTLRNACAALNLVLKTECAANRKFFRPYVEAPLELQSVTVTFKLPVIGINLYRMSDALRNENIKHKFIKNQFPAVGFYTYHDTGYVNVFYSGNVVVTGREYSKQRLDEIRNLLTDFINRHNLRHEYTGPAWMR